MADVAQGEVVNEPFDEPLQETEGEVGTHLTSERGTQENEQKRTIADMEPGKVDEAPLLKRVKTFVGESDNRDRCVTPNLTLAAMPDYHTPHQEAHLEEEETETANGTQQEKDRPRETVQEETANAVTAASKQDGIPEELPVPDTPGPPAEENKNQDTFSYVVVSNDGEEHSVVHLMNAKKIFATQLPKMPREYIVRLVMDRNHETLCLLKNNKTVIGGVCYRPNVQQKFAEIAFLAVDSSEQVRGHGTRLMNELKERVKRDKISYFLTYADNYAIGYFKKQGFSKTITFDEHMWRGYIKDYDGGTLMQCYVDEGVDYNAFADTVKMQQVDIYKNIVSNTKAHFVYRGLDFSNGQTYNDVLDIPGVKESGWTGPPRLVGRRGKLDEDQTLAAALDKVYEQIYMHTSAWPFHKAVDPELYPHYREEIKEPIDLQLVRERLDHHFYTTKDTFEVDISKMCQNCRTFNGDDSTYGKCATVIEKFARSLLRRTLRGFNGSSN